MKDELDEGYVKAKLEEITAALCKLEPLPALISGMKTTIDDMVKKVEGHDVTLYGEKQETGLVARVGAIETRLNQLTGIVIAVGTPLLLAFLIAAGTFIWQLITHEIVFH